MKVVQNPVLLEQYMKQNAIGDLFDTENLEFRLIAFEKDENVNRHLNPRNTLLFLVEGIVKISAEHEDGSEFILNVIDHFSLLGDMEFVNKGVSQYTIITLSEGYFIALPLQGQQEKLNQDIRFLHFLLNNIVEKMEGVTTSVCEPSNLKDRVLHYMRKRWNNQLRHVEASAKSLGCSRRQLQRVLISLQKEGIIEKTAKGHYRLREENHGTV